MFNIIINSTEMPSLVLDIYLEWMDELNDIG
jgi:hypothetical protein